MSFIISGKIKKGFFKERLNRFVCLVEIDEIVHNCHLPNPGRMIELLIPNITPVLVKLNDSPTRKTKATLIAVIKETEIINLDTSIVSNWFEYEIKNKTFSGLNHCNLIRKEIPILHHRIDFLLADGNEKEIFVEIKSTTLVRNGVACFPDGVSKRAVSQLKLLKELSDKGGNVLIIFIVQRKSNSFSPCSDIDPEFAMLFSELQNSNIKFMAIQSSCILSQINDNFYLSFKMDYELPINQL